jgi:hypothetical protein
MFVTAAGSTGGTVVGVAAAVDGVLATVVGVVDAVVGLVAAPARAPTPTEAVTTSEVAIATSFALLCNDLSTSRVNVLRARSPATRVDPTVRGVGMLFRAPAPVKTNAVRAGVSADPRPFRTFLPRGPRG